MTTYTVIITGTCSIDVEANSQEEAEGKVPQAISDSRIGIWDMNLEWEVFNEENE